MTTLQPLESSDLFGFVAGLPMHPLVVHAAVVLLPLSALVLVVLVFMPAWRSRFGWVTIAGLAAGTGAAFVAKESGEALAAKVGLPADHAFWGGIIVPVSIGLFVVAVAWLLLRNRAARTSGRSMAATIASGLVVVLALAATAITVIVGHSGAQAVWAGGTGEKPAQGASAVSYTMDDVKAHASAADCWSVIDKTVYNLTTWEGQHPGGKQVIVGLCGTDGTAAFKGQHGIQKKPVSALTPFAIGTIGGAKPTASTSASTSSTPTASDSPGTLGMAAVKKHASASSCWSIIDGEVFDLTKWINRHPGGAKRILDLCGQDGSKAFHSQHGNSGKASQTLSDYSLGKLG